MNALTTSFSKRKISEYELPNSLAMRISAYLEFNPGTDLGTFKALLKRTADGFTHWEELLIGPDIKTARAIERRYALFLDSYDKLSKPLQLLVLAGVRYFIERNSNTEKMCSLSNFDDDIRIVNYILFSLGAESGYLTI